MAWTLPSFNLSVDVYANAVPPPGAPLYRSVCAWVQPRRVAGTVFNSSYPLGQTPISYLLLPTGVSLIVAATNTNYYWLQLVGMANCRMFAIHQTLVGAGHDNEHVQLACGQFGAWPLVLPSPTPNP